MYSDPIADMLTRIRNASAAKKGELALPFSKFKLSLAKLLEKEGFVSNVKEITGEKMKMLQMTLKYGPDGESIIAGIKRISKPGQRIYVPVDKLPRTNSGYGITVVSTPKGLLTDRQARKDRVGGEVVCQVW